MYHIPSLYPVTLFLRVASDVGVLHTPGKQQEDKKKLASPVLQKMRGNRDNLGIIIHIFPLKHIL